MCIKQIQSHMYSHIDTFRRKSNRLQLSRQEGETTAKKKLYTKTKTKLTYKRNILKVFKASSIQSHFILGFLCENFRYLFNTNLCVSK